MISISNSLFETLVVCAFRYALGRKTYVVGSIVGILHQYWTDIPEPTREQIYKEILKYRETFGNLGHQCDEREWISVVDRFREDNLA